MDDVDGDDIVVVAVVNNYGDMMIGATLDAALVNVTSSFDDFANVDV